LNLQIRMLGGKEVVQYLVRAGDAGRAACDAAAYAVSAAVMAESIPMTPKRFGILRGSHYITRPQNGTCVVGFGGAASAYAAIQHNKQFKNYTTPNTGPGYLSHAIDKIRPRADDICIDIMRRALLRGQAPTYAPTAPTSPPAGSGGQRPSTGARRRKRGRR
jgi:hypothetical protein